VRSASTATEPGAWAADAPAWCHAAATGLGAYVHVPFCSHRCGYCDFAAFAGLDDLMQPYVERLITEIGVKVAEPAASVFVGGGTPSRLGPELLGRLLAAVPVGPGAEVTVEMNPESATREVLAAAAAGGCNRVSFGMQSSAPHVLAFLERRHDPSAVAAAVVGAREAGISTVNLDLIYGTPGESAADWEASLDAALGLEPDHISAYALTVEGATPLGRAVAEGRMPAPDDDVCADRLAALVSRLGEAGFVRYEVSNWSRGAPCLHNLRYWSDGAYVGCGNGAHGYDPVAGVRSWNHRHPTAYAASVDPEAGREVLDDATRRHERLFLGLRRCAGVEWADPGSIPPELLAAGLVAAGGGRLRLTDAGMAVASAVTARLAEAAESDV